MDGTDSHAAADLGLSAVQMLPGPIGEVARAGVGAVDDAVDCAHDPSISWDCARTAANVLAAGQAARGVTAAVRAGGVELGAAAPGIATEEGAVLRGTNAPGEVTSRPGPFRRGTLQDAWDEAPVGPNGGRVCPTCGIEVEVPPNSGTPRDWDGSHNPSWTNREFPPDVTRQEVLDNYNEGVSLECQPCNRGGGNRDERFSIW